MSTSANSREARWQSRFEKLTSTDAQLVAAQPDPAISAIVDGPDVLLADVIRTVMNGYADRPALGQRAVEFVTDANARPGLASGPSRMPWPTTLSSPATGWQLWASPVRTTRSLTWHCR